MTAEPHPAPPYPAGATTYRMGPAEVLFIFPLFFVLGGGIYSVPASLVTKEKEPWLSLLLALGLGLSIFGIGWLIFGIPPTRLLMLWACCVVGLNLIRLLYNSCEAFFIAHLLTLLAVCSMGSFQHLAERKARKTPAPPEAYAPAEFYPKAPDPRQSDTVDWWKPTK